jgi:hypothetical protein
MVLEATPQLGMVSGAEPDATVDAWQAHKLARPSNGASLLRISPQRYLARTVVIRMAASMVWNTEKLPKKDGGGERKAKS